MAKKKNSKALARLKKQSIPVLPICNICGNPDLLIIKISIKDKDFQIKVCNSCQSRSKMKENK